MSSVASQRALLLALGGVSIAALFVWYIQSKKREDERKRTKRELSSPTPTVQMDEVVDDVVVVANGKTVRQAAESDTLESSTKEHENVPVINVVPVPTESTEPSSSVEEPAVSQEEVEEVASEAVVEDVSESEAVDEGLQGSPSLAGGDCGAALLETDVNPMVDSPEEEATTDKEESSNVLKNAGAGDGPVAVSNEQENDKTVPNGEIVVPVEEKEKVDEVEEEEIVLKRTTVELAAAPVNDESMTSVEDSENSEAIKEELALSVNNHETDELSLDCTHVPKETAPFSWSDEMDRSYTELDDHKSRQIEGYEHSDSSGAESEHSEISSQDSGRATGGLASSLSPMDDGMDNLPLYEFEIPNSLVGLVIGIKGKTIKELSTRTDVKMLIRQHYVSEKLDTHQICQVRGKRDQINRCLQMLRRRFPPNRFPDLNLQPVLPPPLPTNLFDAFAAQPCWLTLPERIPCEVVCSSIMNPGHFFLQQPTHPTYSSLAHLDLYMLSLYSQNGSTIPELPKPCQTGLLCAAPVLSAWFRAVTVAYYEETDEVLLRFVDYGGYSTVPRADLRQIRTDLMSLPFQSTECYLAHVQPVDGTWQWADEALEFFKDLVANKVINGTLIGHHSEQKVHMVELTVEVDGKPLRVDRALMEAGFAKASDPSKMVPVQSSVSNAKRHSLKTQTSQVAAS